MTQGHLGLRRSFRPARVISAGEGHFDRPGTFRRARGRGSGTVRAGPLSLVADADRTHDSCHARRLERDGLRQAALKRGIDQSREIHHLVQRLHIHLVGSLQRGMLIEQRQHLGADLCISGASVKPALPVGGTSGNGACQEQGTNESVSRFPNRRVARNQSLLRFHGH